MTHLFTQMEKKCKEVKVSHCLSFCYLCMQICVAPTNAHKSLNNIKIFCNEVPRSVTSESCRVTQGLIDKL